MKTNPHSYLASFYRYFYLTDTLPNNLCNYCWGLIFAFLVFPFVWMSMLINRINKKITFNEELYDHYENWEFVDRRPRNRYEVEFNPMQTAYGLFFTFCSVLLGGVVLFKFFGYVPAEKVDVGGLLPGMVVLYFIGIATAVSVIIVVYTIRAIVLFFLKFKKDPTIEEREEKARLVHERELSRIKKRQYREKNPSAVKLFWRYIVALKEKNCPLLEWDYDKKKK